MSEQTELVTKREALKMAVHLINKPGCMDVNTLIELLIWEKKLVLWLLKEAKQEDKLHELLPELSGELQETLRVRQTIEVC